MLYNISDLQLENQKVTDGSSPGHDPTVSPHPKKKTPKILPPKKKKKERNLGSSLLEKKTTKQKTPRGLISTNTAFIDVHFINAILLAGIRDATYAYFWVTPKTTNMSLCCFTTHVFFVIFFRCFGEGVKNFTSVNKPPRECRLRQQGPKLQHVTSRVSLGGWDHPRAKGQK